MCHVIANTHGPLSIKTPNKANVDVAQHRGRKSYGRRIHILKTSEISERCCEKRRYFLWVPLVWVIDHSRSYLISLESIAGLLEEVMQEVLSQDRDHCVRRDPHVVGRDADPQSQHSLVLDALREAVQEARVRQHSLLICVTTHGYSSSSA
jgi:hypothetical protein